LLSIRQHVQKNWQFFRANVRHLEPFFFGQIWVISNNSEQFLGRRYGIVGFGQFSTCPQAALKQFTFVETSA